MASRFLASRAASLLKVPVYLRCFAAGTIDESQLNEEMKKLLGGAYSSPKNENENKKKNKRSIIKTFRYEEDGKWLLGSNIYLVDDDEDLENVDNRNPTSGMRYVINEKGILLGAKAFINNEDEELAKLGAHWLHVKDSEMV